LGVARAVARVALWVAGLAPWVWFAWAEFVAGKLQIGSLAEVYELIGPQRWSLALAQLGVSLLLLVAFLLWASYRMGVSGTWRFKAWSLGRCTKWITLSPLVGFVLIVIPTNTLSAELYEKIPSYNDPRYSTGWALQPWLLPLACAFVACVALLVVDATRRRVPEPVANTQPTA
jgi:hypothetical protein